jgi:probable phosphomutase (TIGR03848 family)
LPATRASFSREMPRRPKPPPATVLLLVRHGQTPTTGRDLPERGPGPGLTEEGKKQAEEAAYYIAEWRAALPPLAAIYCSPLTRARETAGILGKTVDIAPVERPELIDCDAGEWAGAPIKDLVKKPEWATVVRYPSSFRFPGGEGIKDMSDRMVAAARALVNQHPGQTLVIVSHADPIKAVVTDALGLHLDLFQRVVIAPASVSAIAYGDASPAVTLVNWTGPSGHLPTGRTPEKRAAATKASPH